MDCAEISSFTNTEITVRSLLIKFVSSNPVPHTSKTDMAEHRSYKNDFLKKATEIIEDNIADDRFGVSELAREMGMSRSNLLRKVKSLSGQSVSQFIRQIKLEHAMELLKRTSLNVSEVSFKVGFTSTSYFIKCFREHYGYPPGEAGKREPEDDIKSAASAGLGFLFCILATVTGAIWAKSAWGRFWAGM